MCKKTPGKRERPTKWRTNPLKQNRSKKTKDDVALDRVLYDGDDPEGLRRYLGRLKTPLSPRRTSTILFRCAHQGAPDCVQMMLREYSTAPNDSLLARSGNTLLHHSAYYGRLAVVEVLLENGFYNESINKYGETAFDCAKNNGQTRVLRAISEFQKALTAEGAHRSATPELKLPESVSVSLNIVSKLAKMEKKCTELFCGEFYTEAATYQPRINSLISEIERRILQHNEGWKFYPKTDVVSMEIIDTQPKETWRS